MGVSQKAFNYNQRMRLNKKYDKRELPNKVDTKIKVCDKCGFKAFYIFLRCPECLN